MNFDEEVAAIRADLRKFRQTSNKSTRKLAAIRSAAVAPGMCPVYYKFKRAGFSHITSDSICRSAHRYGISSKSPLDEILTAIKIASKVDGNGVGFQDNSTNSKGPGGPGIAQDEMYSVSTYQDLASCKSKFLEDHPGTDPSEADDFCQKYFGNGGDAKYSTRSQLPSNILISSGGKVVNTKGGSVNKKPHWLVTSEYLKQGGIESSGHVKSASTKTAEEHATYMKHVMESHDQAVERRNLADTESENKVKSAITKTKRPHWQITREHVFKE